VQIKTHDYSRKDKKWNANILRKDVKDRTANLNTLKAQEATEQPTAAGTRDRATVILETSAGMNRETHNPHSRNAQKNQK
jgi:hypothetical protein